MTHVDIGCKVLALDKTGSETSSKGITGTVGVSNLSSIKSMDWELLHSVLLGVGVVGNGQGSVGTLSEDNSSWLLGVGLWKGSNVLSNSSQVASIKPVGLSVGGSLRLVADDKVGVWNNLSKWVLEELWDEWSREVEDKILVGLSSVLTKKLNGIWGNGEVEATNVKGLTGLNVSPVLWLLKVRWLEVVSSSKVSDKRSVNTVNESSTLTSGNIILHHVGGGETNRLVGLNQLVGVHILPNRTKVKNRVLWKNVLGTSSSVLSSTTSNKLDVVHLKHLFKNWHVLFLNKDGIVLLKLVLVQVALFNVNLKVKQWVPQTDQFVGHCVGSCEEENLPCERKKFFTLFSDTGTFYLMDRQLKDKKGADVKRRQIFKPLLSNPYTPRQNWTKIDPSDQLLVLESLTRQVLTPVARWNLLSKKDQDKELEKEGRDPKYSLFKDRLLIVLGYNAIMKTLEDKVQQNVRREKVKPGVLFVSKGDMPTPLLYHHLPMLCALAGVKLIQLPKNSSSKLGKALNLKSDVSIVYVDGELISHNETLNKVIEGVEVVDAGILNQLRSTTIDMNVKFLATDAPIRKR